MFLLWKATLSLGSNLDHYDIMMHSFLETFVDYLLLKEGDSITVQVKHVSSNWLNTSAVWL